MEVDDWKEDVGSDTRLGLLIVIGFVLLLVGQHYKSSSLQWSALLLPYTEYLWWVLRPRATRLVRCATSRDVK